MSSEVADSVWYFAESGRQLGPIGESDLVAALRSGQLPLSTLVWSPGMTAWASAASVDALARQVPPAPHPRAGDGVRPRPAARAFVLKPGPFRQELRIVVSHSIAANLFGALASVGVAVVNLNGAETAVVPLFWSLAFFALTVWLIRNLIRNIVWLSHLERHPSVEALGRHGDPRAIIDRIERTAQSLGKTRPLDLAFGAEAVCFSTAFRVHVVFYPDVLWAFERVTTTRIYGVLPGDRTYELVIVERPAREHRRAGSEKRVKTGLATLAHFAPWAIYGYSDETAALLRTSPGEFHALVDQRYQRMTGVCHQA